MSAHARHLVRTLAIACCFAAVPVLVATLDASAYVTGNGTGSARATVTTLAAPAIARTSTGSGTVTLTWSTVTAPASGTVSYYVSRDGGAASATCPSSASPTTATSCTDTGVSTGSHSYTVTAVWRTWRSTSARANVTVTLGAATQLVFTTQPGGTPTGGSAFGTQPVVTARDASNAPVTDYSGTVTLSIVTGTGTAGAALSGCTGTLRNGVTTFSGCKIDRAGSSYRLRASAGTLNGDSAAFNVSVGSTAALAFTTQPGGASGGSAFTTQPVVTAVDAGGNTVSGFTSTVSIALVSGTGTAGADLDCDSERARSGVATFSGCEIDLAGAGYQLRASASGGFRGDSAAFDVSVGAVIRLDFTTDPAGAAVRTAFATQPVVTAQDAGGNTVTTYNGTVTLAIVRFSGASGAVLSGCTGTLRSGVTTFSGCQIDRVGSDYELRASDGPRTADSNEFPVVAGPATQLVFTTTPSSASGGAAFSTQPVVTARDADGNTATSYAGTVALTVNSGPAGGALTACTGSLRSGVTTFSGCKLDRAGSYTLRASDGTLSAASTSITVNVGSTAALVFTTQPGGALDDTIFTTQPVLTAVDAGGNTVTSYNSTITLSIVSGTGTSGASISGCSSTRTSGVTTFRGCLINRRGTAYVLRASDGTRTVNSSAFDVR
jgi:trimeric autotransporter adhesin